MKISHVIRRSVLTFASALLLGTMQLNAGILTDLPTIRVNGQIMYYYDAQSGDNIYTIADKLGVSVEQIRAYNPSVADGIKPRMRLLFPSDLTTTDSGSSAGPLSHVVQKGESIYGIAHKYGMTVDELLALNPFAAQGLRPNQRLLLSSSTLNAANGGSSASIPEVAKESVKTVIDDEPQSGNIVTPSQTETAVGEEKSVEAAAETAFAQAEVADNEPIDIAVILPFMLEESKMGRSTQLYTEFYKGFLLAASEANRDGLTPLKIHTFDSASNLDSVRTIMRLPAMQEVELIVAPDNQAQLAAIAQDAPENTLILNLFAVKDTSYVSLPGMIQANIPHDEMYARAIEGFIARFNGVTPVFVTRKGGKTDKEEFTAQLKAALSRKGIIYRTLHFDGYLSDADLEEFDIENGRFVFIPVSGNRDEFSRMVHALKILNGKSIDPEAVQLFGYPEWATFRGDQFKEICELTTTIYSRYTPAEQSLDAKQLDRKFSESYGEGLIDKQLPVLGILGYDMGRFVIDGMRRMVSTGSFPTSFDGIQSGLRLTSAGENGGMLNNALFLISYAPGEIVTSTLVAPQDAN